VEWTATDAAGMTTVVTQFINAPELFPAITPALVNAPLAATCTPTGVRVQVPAPTTTAASGCTATTTGAVININGNPQLPPLALAPDGSVAATPGTMQVQWSATDSLGLPNSVSQIFQVTVPGPCFSEPGAGGWHSTAGGPVTGGKQPGGGPGSALEIITTNSWNSILSPKFSTNALVVGNFLLFDLYLPPNLASRPWWGGVQALLSVPSANLFNVPLGGNNDLKGSKLPLGQFSTIKIPLTPAVRTALHGSHNDVTVEIDLNSPVGSPPVGPWYLQNFRFGN
jgi:hypothetical protein